MTEDSNSFLEKAIVYLGLAGALVSSAIALGERQVYAKAMDLAITCPDYLPELSRRVNSNCYSPLEKVFAAPAEKQAFHDLSKK